MNSGELKGDYGQMARLLASETVWHGVLDSAIKNLKIFHEGIKRNSECRCLFLTGFSGTGKTTLIGRYMQRFPIEKHIIVDRRRVAYVRAPSRSTIKGLGTKILTEFGCPVFSRMPDYEISANVRKLLRELRVELLFIDEVDDMIEWRSQSTIFPKLVANFIKEILQETDTGIVLAGPPKILVISNLEVQLRNRSAAEIALRGLHLTSPKERIEYIDVLKSLSTLHPLPFDFDVSEKWTALRLQFVTGGNVGETKHILEVAATRAGVDEVKAIGMRHLRHAIEEHVRSQSDIVDPFELENAELASFIETSAQKERSRRVMR